MFIDVVYSVKWYSCGDIQPHTSIYSNGYVYIRVSRFFSIPPVNIVRVRPRSTIYASLFQLRHSKRSHPHFSAGGCVVSLYSRYMSFSSCPFCISSPLPLRQFRYSCVIFCFLHQQHAYTIYRVFLWFCFYCSIRPRYIGYILPFPISSIILQFPSIPPKGYASLTISVLVIYPYFSISKN